MRFYWFWLFLLYSFGGYVLEKLYAAARRSPHQVRKCFLLLPLCPVRRCRRTAPSNPWPSPPCH